jgi:hypothetical protein
LGNTKIRTSDDDDDDIMMNIRACFSNFIPNFTWYEVAIKYGVGFGSTDLADIEGMPHLHKVGLVRGSRFGRVVWGQVGVEGSGSG